MYNKTMSENSLPSNPAGSSAGLADIGVNLMNSAFDRDRMEVIAAALTAGVKTLVITGSSLESSAEAAAFVRANARSLAEMQADCRTTAGVHPHNAKGWDAAMRARLRELIEQDAASQTIAAVGECGLDYNRNFSPPPAQRKCFEEQLALAATLHKPVFLHERDAFNDFFSILKEHRPGLPGAVVHCFTGAAAELEAYLSLDCHIGITGWICDERRGSHLVPLLRHIPAGRLLLETDAPYLLPRSLPRAARGKSGRNEPRFLSHIAAFAAEVLGKTKEQLAEETFTNAARFFGI